MKECNFLADIFNLLRTKPTYYGLSDYILALISALLSTRQVLTLQVRQYYLT